MTDPYEILGVSPDATDTEVKNAYRALARKYHPDNYQSSPTLAKQAEEKMKEINAAYEEINKRRNRTRAGGKTHSQSSYAEIRNMINARRIREAENALAAIPEAERGAEWHFLKSCVLMQRGYVNDAMREMETACNMDPNNMEYQQAKQMFNQQAGGFGMPYGGGQAPYSRQQECSTCDMCSGLIMADCCCECMGGDLIPCC